MSFFLPQSSETNENEDVITTFKRHKLPVNVLGVDLIMDFVLDGLDAKGRNIIIVTELSKTEGYSSVLN